MAYQNEEFYSKWAMWDPNDAETARYGIENRDSTQDDFRRFDFHDMDNYRDKEAFCHKNEFVIAMAYVPWQKWGPLFCGCEALFRGTIFPELYKPFLGKEYQKDERR